MPGAGGVGLVFERVRTTSPSHPSDLAPQHEVDVLLATRATPVPSPVPRRRYTAWHIVPWWLVSLLTVHSTGPWNGGNDAKRKDVAGRGDRPTVVWRGSPGERAVTGPPRGRSCRADRSDVAGPCRVPDRVARRHSAAHRPLAEGQPRDARPPPGLEPRP